MPKFVIVKRKHYRTEDELYTHWYVCPKCWQANIIPMQHYCGDCGIALRWSREAVKEFEPKPRVQDMKPENGLESVEKRIKELKG